jgi:quercetin dioxygenase-like cupin family protein
MNKQGKVWGNTVELFTKNNVSIHRIEINKDSCCSKHYHDHKYNTFYVETGKIKIQEWKNDYNLLDETILSKGEMCQVPPKNNHRFIGLEDSIVYEIYHVELCEKDIIREDVGKEQYENLQ